jgi:quercetin dioxygenase-like cupin family protein
MISFQHYRSGTLYGIQYWFGSVGDALPEHAHDPTTVHNVVLLCGSVDVTFGAHVVRLTPGVVFDFDGTQRHRVIANTAHSSVLNLYLHGIPPGYDALPAHELQGTLES